MKKDRKIWIWVAVIGVIILFMQPGGIGNSSNNVQNLIDTIKEKVSGGGGSVQGNANLGNPEKDFMSIRLYDINGNLIKTQETFSVVQIGSANITGVYYIDYTVSLLNTGTRDLTCKLDSVSPISVFECASCALSSSGVTGAPAIIKPIDIPFKSGQRISWTSNRIPTSGIPSMEGLTQPIALTAQVTCKYTENSIDYPTTKTGSFTFTVRAYSGTSNFEVSVLTGGIPTEYCGDGTCQSPFETATNCVSDCLFIPKITFRTSDNNYPSGSAIAYNGGTCSGTTPLIRYGYVTGSIDCTGQTGTSCPTTTGILTGATLISALTDQLPGNPTWAKSGKDCLYQKGTQLITAFQQTANSPGPCTNQDYWGVITYDTASPFVTNVRSDALSVDSSKEKSCT